jgi:hypothetical protein
MSDLGAKRALSLSDGRFAFAYALLLAVVAAGVWIAVAVPHDAGSCDEALVPEHVPRSWPQTVAYPGLAGFRLVRGQRPNEAAAFVVEDGVCPGEGARLELDAWDLVRLELSDLRIRREHDSDLFVLTRVEHDQVPTVETMVGASGSRGYWAETPLLAFRPQPRMPFAIPPKQVLMLEGLDLAAAAAIMWGIARARRRLRLFQELLDPDRFAEATCREDGTLWIGGSALVVRGEASPRVTRPGRVVVRVARESGGDYRTPPTAHVADAFRGDRQQASDRQMRRASIILSAFTALTISIAIVAGLVSLDAWVSREGAERDAFSRRASLRNARLAEALHCFVDASCDEGATGAR